jgi:hypothetical protein
VGGSNNSTFVCSALEAAKTIPSERTPLSFPGLRLAKTKTIRFTISSIGINGAKPDTICLGFPSPKSISSTYNLSDFSTRLQELNRN